jgi:transcription elongation factor Elf1
MATCQNCNKKLSCGCQKRTASDGKSVCSNCLGKYEMGIKKTLTQNAATTTVNKLTHVWRTPNK